MRAAPPLLLLLPALVLVPVLIALPLLLHGDAAFAGQGVVAECFTLMGLKGFRTGGTVHFIVNNQIGFTTAPHWSRSSPYPSDVAKMIEAPIFHCNGDDPEAVVYAAKIAIEFRQKFHKPVVIDMFCYRRFGHNETDEPAFTQPLMYKRIAQQPTVVTLYGKRLVEEGVISEAEFDAMKAAYRKTLDDNFTVAENYKANKADWLDGRWAGLKAARDHEEPRKGETGVPLATLKEIGLKLTKVPKTFKVHRTMQRVLDARRKMIEDGTGLDWAMGEHLAHGLCVFAQGARGVRAGVLAHLFGVALDHHATASVTTLGPQVDQPVAGADHIQVVFDDDQRMPGFQQAAQGTHELGDVVKVQAGGGLIKHEQATPPRCRLAAGAARLGGIGQKAGELEALRLAARQGGHRLPQLHVLQPDIHNRLKGTDHVMVFGKQGNRFAHREVQHIGHVEQPVIGI